MSYFVPFQRGSKKRNKMERKISQNRKLSTDMQRKLSAISNCSDVSNLSVMLGMDPNDFKSTIQNILGKKFQPKIVFLDWTTNSWTKRNLEPFLHAVKKRYNGDLLTTNVIHHGIYMKGMSGKCHTFAKKCEWCHTRKGFLLSIR